MRRKFLASILAFCMVLTLFPMTAFAAASTKPVFKATSVALETEGAKTATFELTSPSIADATNVSVIVYEAKNDGSGKADTASTKVEGSIEVGENDDPTTITLSVKSDAATGTTLPGTYYIAIDQDTTDSETTESEATEVTVTDYVAPSGDEVNSLTVTPTTLTLKVGAESTLSATVDPSTATVSWSSSDTTVASVANGKVTANKVGSATITATAGEKTATCAVTVEAATVQKTALTTAMFDTIAAQTYTGEAIEPAVTPKDGDGNPTAADYTVAYSDNINVGTGKITVTAKSDSEKFTGSAVINFTINKATLTPTVALKADQTISKVYDGTTAVAAADLAKLAISFKVGAADKALTQGTDYTVSATYDNATAGDTKTITVTIALKDGSDAAGNYALSSTTGTVTGAITKKTSSLSVDTYVKVKPSDSSATPTTLAASDYVGLPSDSYTYALKENETYTGLTAAVDSSTGALTLTATAEVASTTPVPVTIIATGVNNVVTINVKATLTSKTITTITATAAEDLTYDGTAKNGYAAAPTAANVTGENKFSFTYNTSDKAAPKDAGTYTVTIELNDETYVADPLVLEFTIAPASISGAVVTLTDGVTYTYTGEPIIPTITSVKASADANAAALVKDKDYTIENTSNTNASDSATITLKGTGNYTGDKAVTFTIAKAAVTPPASTASVAVGASTDIVVNTDGTITATSGNADIVTATAGTGKVTITGVAAGTATVTISAVATTNYNELADTTVTVTVTSGGGSSSGGGSTPTEPTDPVDPNPPSTGEDVTQTVTPDVSDGTASATVDKDTADKLVSDAVDNKSENVTVKVDVPAGSDVNEVKADIPASAVADLASKTDAALTVDTPVANVTIPNETLSQLGGASGNVTVTAAVNEDNSVKVEVQANGSTVGSLNGGMKVDLPVSQPTAGTVAVLVDENGNETILPKSSLDGSEMAVLLETGSATIKFVDNAQSFADTDSHWAKNSIAFVSSRNLFQGMENNNFKADVPMNRAMLVTVLHRLESTPDAAGSSFDDVPSDSYYATAAAWAAGKGIVTGDASGFSGDRSVTREEMAVMLYRYVQTINGNKGTLGSFSGMGGASDVSSWANQAMRWAVGSGIISGDNSGNLNPGSTATRGEVSQMLMNFVKLITK